MQNWSITWIGRDFIIINIIFFITITVFIMLRRIAIKCNKNKQIFVMVHWKVKCFWKHHSEVKCNFFSYIFWAILHVSCNNVTKKISIKFVENNCTKNYKTSNYLQSVIVVLEFYRFACIIFCNLYIQFCPIPIFWLWTKT